MKDFTRFMLSGWIFPVYAITLIFAFAVGRWGLWCYFPFPMLGADGFEYLELSMEIQHGILPSFHFISAGYPLFIAFCQMFGDGLLPVMIGQQLLTLVVVLWLLFVFRSDIYFLTAAFLFGVIYVLSDTVIRWESSIFPDSLIANSLLVSAILTYLSVTSSRLVYPLVLGFTVFFSVIIRSSSIFMLPLVGVLAALLLLRKDYWKGLVAVMAVVVPLLAMSLYNSAFSLEHQFNFLSYGRMSKTHYYRNGIIKNRIAEPLSIVDTGVPLSKVEVQFVDSILRLLPDTSHLYQYFFSWDPSSYTHSLLHCRHPKFAQVVSDSTFQVCHYEQANVPGGRRPVCYTLSSKDSNEAVQAVGLLSRFDFGNHHYAKLRKFIAYHANISHNHGRIYYGQLKYNYSTSGSREDALVSEYLSDSTLSQFMAYVFEGTGENSDSLGFDTRYAALKKSIPFKIYDLLGDRLLQRYIRHDLWVLFSLAALFFALISLIHNFYRADIAVFLMALSAIAMGSSLVFTLFGLPLPRYSSSTEFVYYLLPLMALAHALRSHLYPHSETDHA